MAGMGFGSLRGRGTGSPATTDRILVGVCVAIWLVLLGVSVAALVALADLGRGFHKMAGNPHTGLLYIIIGVSALVILAAIPLLLRARRPPAPARTAGVVARRAGGPPRRPVGSPARGATDNLATEKLRAAHPVSAVPAEAVDRIRLRGTTALVSTLGAALVAAAGATYLMALGKDVAAWVGYGVAGVVTATMPVVLWVHLRRLRGVLARYRG